MKKKKSFLHAFVETKQGKLIAGLSLIALVLALFLAKNNVLNVVLLILLGSLVTLINLHEIHCMLHGHCVGYSWFKTFITCGYTVLFIVLAIQMLHVPGRQQPPTLGAKEVWHFFDPKARHQALLDHLKGYGYGHRNPNAPSNASLAAQSY